METQSVMVRRMEMVMELRDALLGVEGLGAELKPERVQEWLAARPEWRLGLSGRTLHHTKELPTVEAAAQYGNYVASLAGGLSLPVRVSIEDRKIGLVLFSGRHESRHTPLTQAVLDFAAQLG